ncbi:MAG: LemA family protein [Candidatus Thiodiazotropha sp.]|nr:LemA family protein [Candidatus Thiodiazotropha sp.]MCU7802007.1 LemA family protein [Candidatus Thiodiazotropha sp. (ex Lucinoma borealis)]MCU7838422.1 LemA family protein [Candidatus Thiodiazotropha sp. (ex Troendleina suluensis)]MCU7883368.1 LemA family protein [Candidatus Thiodiazotropha sp. (ex Lucinoma annulata)]MCM8883624.1 LemA family protein [Candidatus Thiodiazotropha sp.]
MEIVIFVLIGTAVAILIYAVLIYNNLVRLKHDVTKAWSNIDVLLKQRHDELPKLIETCKQYMKFEQETLEKVMLARAAVNNAMRQGDVGAVGAAESQLRLGLGNLFAVAENYPDLKANDTFLHLQSRITGLENSIADRREFYNDSANINNVRIEQFPDLILARYFSFKPADLLEFDEAELTDVDMGTLFN